MDTKYGKKLNFYFDTKKSLIINKLSIKNKHRRKIIKEKKRQNYFLALVEFNDIFNNCLATLVTLVTFKLGIWQTGISSIESSLHV